MAPRQGAQSGRASRPSCSQGLGRFASCGPALYLSRPVGARNRCWGRVLLPEVFDLINAPPIRYGVTLCLSPPNWPPYNGAVEAGIGWRSMRITHFAVGRLLDDYFSSEGEGLCVGSRREAQATPRRVVEHAQRRAGVQDPTAA
jgi:hypothetical protein